MRSYLKLEYITKIEKKEGQLMAFEAKYRKCSELALI
jgi:hypothetical protein